MFGARSGKPEVFKHAIKGKETVDILPITLNRDTFLVLQRHCCSKSPHLQGGAGAEPMFLRAANNCQRRTAVTLNVQSRLNCWVCNQCSISECRLSGGPGVT
jgi:hypothetical protein